MIETKWLEQDVYGDWCDKEEDAFACGSSVDELFEIPEKAKKIKLAFSKKEIKESYKVIFSGLEVKIDGKGSYPTFDELDEVIIEAELLNQWIYAKVFYK